MPAKITKTDGGSDYVCRAIPADSRLAWLNGLFPQPQDGLWVKRILVLGGTLTGEQWRVIAALARKFTPTTPLHLTMRQNLELHDLRPAQIPAVQDALAEVNLATLGVCGPSLRNIPLCECSGVVAGRVDLASLALQIREMLSATEGIYSLPHKFKMAMSCSRECGQPWINDFALMAVKKDGQWGFCAIIGGTLGPRPEVAMPLVDWVEPSDVLPLVVAVVRVFVAEGGRDKNRGARLKHVRQRLGDEVFRGVVLKAFAEAKASSGWPKVELSEAPEGFSRRLVLTFPDGDVTAEAAEALGRLSDNDDLRVRFTNEQRVVVFGRDESLLRGEVAKLPALREAARPQPVVVTCAGRRWCRRALIDNNKLSARIRTELGGKLPPDAMVRVTACPVGCAHSAVAGVGMTGAIVQCDGNSQEACKLFIGGGKGRTGKLAKLVGDKIPVDKAIAEIVRHLGGL